MNSRIVLLVLALLGVLFLSGCNSDNSPRQVQIDSQPAPQTVAVGATATFTVGASGDGLAYQWQSSSDGSAWTTLAGATSASYAVGGVDLAASGRQYRVVVSGTEGTQTSSAASLTVLTAVSVSAQPADLTLTEGDDAVFSVTAAGDSPTFQWQSSPDGSTWTPIGGATGATLTLSAVALADNGRRLRVVVSNAASSVTSAAATLTVNALPGPGRIVTAPQPVTVAVGQAATFSVVGAGNPAPAYQWQISTDGGTTFADNAGATASSYTTAAGSAGDDGTRFQVHVYNNLGGVVSAPVTLPVNAVPPPVFTLQPGNQNVIAGATATFTAAAIGTPAPTYQWQVSGNGVAFTDVAGATSASYTIGATAIADSGKSYRVVASNSGGSTTSNVAVLRVTAPGLGLVDPHTLTSYDCSPWAMLDGVSVQTTATYPNPLMNGVSTTTMNGSTAYAGHSAKEVEIVAPLGAVSLDTKVYASSDASSHVLTTYGAVSDSSVTSGGNTIVSHAEIVITPPADDTEFALAAGQTSPDRPVTEVTTTTITTNGVPGQPATQTTTSTVKGVTFVGIETVTVGAGTFRTCRVVNTGSAVTNWVLIGSGTFVKDSQGGTATQILVNGQPYISN